MKAIRIQDAGSRRLPFQKKIGAGWTPEEFQKLVDNGTLRHVGITESISMIAAGLGWKLDDITETIEPVIAKKRVKSQYITVESGQAAGVRQLGHGLRGKEEIITLEFEASLGAPESYDAIYISGTGLRCNNAERGRNFRMSGFGEMGGRGTWGRRGKGRY